MDNETARANPEQRETRAWIGVGLFVLGCFAIVLTTAGFVSEWWRDAGPVGRGCLPQISLLAALAFGLIRLVGRNHLVPPGPRTRLLHRLQGQAVLWTAFLLLSTGQVGGKTITIYLIVTGLVTVTNPTTSWQAYGADPHRVSGWLVKCLAALAASLWVISTL